MSTTWIITGCNRGLGLELTRQLSARGDTIIATARAPESAQELTALGVRVERLDVTDPTSVADLARRLEGTAVDRLFNNAGVGVWEDSVSEIDFTTMARVFDANTIGPMRVIQALLPNLMAGKGRMILNMSSKVGSIDDNTSGGAYSYRASKAALNMLNKSLSLELGAKGFVCAVFNPGWVRTDMGGANATIDADESVSGLLKVIDGLTPADNGAFFHYNGERIPW